jgi:hypothetical protein
MLTLQDPFRYTIDCHGNLERAAAELFRLFVMDARSFDAFKASLIAWQPGIPAPCSSYCIHSMRPGFEEKWTTLVVTVLALLRSQMRPPRTCAEALMKVVRISIYSTIVVYSAISGVRM